MRPPLLAVLFVLSVTALDAQAAAPPVSPHSVQRDLKSAALLEQQAYQHALAGRFADALKGDQEALRLRSRWLPEKHPLVQGGRQNMEDWSRLVHLLPEDQKQLGTALRLKDQGKHLYRQRKFAAAERLLRETLAIYRTVLGEENPFTAAGYNNVALCLEAQGLHRKALPLHEKVLATLRQRLGEENPHTASSYTKVADCHNALGQHSKALPLYEKALHIRRKVLGEDHPNTATSYNNLASCLYGLGQHGKAIPLYERALAIWRKTKGEEHPDTAASYNNLASCLYGLGQHGKAIPLYEKVLHIRRKVLGEEHPDTAQSYNNVALCLHDQGQHSKALLLYEKALYIRRKVLGEEHPDTATSCNSLAYCLDNQGQYSKALPLHEQALAIHRKRLGEEHPDTATSYTGLAICLNDQGEQNKALPLYEKALHIRRKVLGEDHPDTATSCNNLAYCLYGLGRHGNALPLFEKALEIHRQMFGESHSTTATSYNNVGCCLGALGRPGKALPLLQKALHIHRQVLGEVHPLISSGYLNVASCLLRQGRIAEATRLLQQSLPGHEVARFHKARSGFDRALAERGHNHPRQVLALCFARLHHPGNAFAHADASLGRALLDDLLGDTEVSALARQLAHLDESLVKLYGRAGLSKEEQVRREELAKQRQKVAFEMVKASAVASARQLLPLADIQKQIPQEAALVFWIAAPPVGEYQACIVRHRGTPIWVRLTGSDKDGKWTQQEQHLHDHLFQLLADPQAGSTLERQNAISALRRLYLAPLLPHLGARAGLGVVRQLLVVPTGWAARVPLEVLTSDYRVSYVPSGSAFARLRQQARPLSGTSMLALGDPAFNYKPGPRPETLLALRGPEPAPLPGTRREVKALARLIPSPTIWLGSDASEQRLDELIRQGKLKSYRLIHLATHGQFNWDHPELSSVLLARDRLPDPLRQAQQNKKVYTGALTVDTIRRDWRGALDADLVVLSACVTGIGTETDGDGMLGFAQAFLSRGARCVVLSRWHVNDDATALLMRRFYQNLLGKRPGLKKAMGRAAALEEARNWLRNLSRQEAGAAVASLPRGEVKPLPGTAKAPAARPVPPGEKPYAHPYYWSAFVLIGDPD
jgi:CHAT domain-containing protein/tetratricopeptide (TPR) repeat protein